MNRMKLLSIVFALLMIFSCAGVMLAQAETQPEETIPDVTEPVATVVAATDPTDVSDPVQSDTTEPSGTSNTESTDSTDGTYPTDYTEYEATQRPTEYSESFTYSDYVSPAPIYTPGEQNYDTNDWENLELSLDVADDANQTGNKKGPGSFAGMKNDKSKGDRVNSTVWWLGIIFWCLSLAAITFAVLYRPAKPATSNNRRPAVKSKTTNTESRRNNTGSKNKRPAGARNYERKYSDDYNDGF